MNIKPILFSTPMVQAILEGRKTMTRRTKGLECVNDEPDYYVWCNEVNQMDIPREAKPFDENYYYEFTGKFNNFSSVITTCPYGKPGDILYVRENWQLTGWDFEDSEVYIKFTDGETQTFYLDYDAPDHDKNMNWLIRQIESLENAGFLEADEENERVSFTDKPQPFKPNIHLPKFCSRIFLKIIDVRPERLQDISPGDACDEGIAYCNVDADAFEGGELQADFKNYTWKDDESYEDYHFPTFANCIDSFRTLWIKINSKESWLANPWVWVIEFIKTEKPEILTQ